MQARCQSANFPAIGCARDFSRLRLPAKFKQMGFVQGFALSDGWTSLAGRRYQIGTASA